MKHLTLLFLLFSLNAISQNLIPNPGFESKSDCPGGLGQLQLANGWFSANYATPDYFNDCSPTFEYGTEFNKKGGQIPHSGHGYAGIKESDLHDNIYYEYIETDLTTPLQAGKSYCIKMYASLGNADCAVKQLGIIVSQTPLRSNGVGIINLSSIPLVSNYPLTDSLAWTCVWGTYKAIGNEKYLTIGFFGKADEFIRLRQNLKLDASFYSAYYFLDDISLVAVKENEECDCTRETR